MDARVSGNTMAALLAIREQLLQLRGQIDAALATLPTPAPATPPTPPEPTYLPLTKYAQARRIGVPRLRAYITCGCPHRRRGRLWLLDPVKADAWIEANHDHPMVTAAVRAAIDKSTGRTAPEKAEPEE